MIKKNTQQNPPDQKEHSQHFLQFTEASQVKPLEPDHLSAVLESAEAYAEARIMEISGHQKYQDALEELLKSNRPGGPCGRMIREDELAW